MAEDYELVETCPDCGKGEIVEIDLKHLSIKQCNLCEHREVTKK